MLTLNTIRQCTLAILMTALLSSGSVLSAGPKWMMAAFDGRCIPMESFDQIGPPTHTPDEFVSYLRAEGQKVSVSPVPSKYGRALLVEVGPRKQPFVFVTADNCGGKEPLQEKLK